MNKPTFVCFDVSNTGWQIDYDCVVAEKIDNNQYKLTGIPGYVYGFSSQDIVIVKEQNSRLIAQEVVQRGGHSTFRLVFKEQKDIFEQFKDIALLHEMGCHFDKPLYTMFTIDVPQQVDIEKVIQILKDGEDIGRWEYEEGYVYHPKNS